MDSGCCTDIAKYAGRAAKVKMLASFGCLQRNFSQHFLLVLLEKKKPQESLQIGSESFFGSKSDFIERPLKLKIRLRKFLEVMNKIYAFLLLSQVHSTER